MLKVIACGRLTDDIKVQPMLGDSDSRVANFSLACRDNSITEFADCTAWDKVADTLAKYTKKGDMIYIEGRLKTKHYVEEVTKTKQKRVFTVVDKFEFLERKQQDQNLFTQQNPE